MGIEVLDFDSVLVFATNPLVTFFAGGILLPILINLISNMISNFIDREKDKRLEQKVDRLGSLLENSIERDRIYRKIGVSSLSKEKIMQKMRKYGLRVETIVFETGILKGDTEKRDFRGRIKQLGFRGIGPQLNRGVYFLPPNRMPHIGSKFDPAKWFYRNAIEGIKYERLNIPFLFVLDLAEMKTIKGDPNEIDFYGQLGKHEIISVQNLIKLAEKRRIPLDEFLRDE